MKQEEVWNELLSLYDKYGNTRIFQNVCVNKLSFLTDVFIKKSGIKDDYHGELKSYLWFGYFYAFDTFDKNKQCSISSWTYGISMNRMLNFIRDFNARKKDFDYDIKDCIDEVKEEDNEMNEILVKKMLNEARIVGLDYEIFVRRRGLIGYKKMTDKEILNELGVKEETLTKSIRRHKNRLWSYKKQNKE